MTIQNKDAISGGEDLKKDTQDLEGEDQADKGLEGEIKPLLEGNEDDEITIKRGSLKKLHGVKENYKTVAMSKKGKTGKDGEGKALDTTKKPDAQAGADIKSEYVTKADLEKKNETDAIKRIENPAKDLDPATKALYQEINENWDEVKTFYTGKNGKADPDIIIEDILDAHAAWKRRNGGKTKDGKGTAAADLATHRGSGGASPKPNQQTTPRKSLLNKGVSPKDWYPKKTT